MSRTLSKHWRAALALFLALLLAFTFSFTPQMLRAYASEGTANAEQTQLGEQATDLPAGKEAPAADQVNESTGGTVGATTPSAVPAVLIQH